MPDERNLYRQTRRAFVAACEAAGIDTITRVQPGQGQDGKPLFTDTAALGARLATRATLIVSNDTAGAHQQIAQLLPPPPGARLVLVHALDPAHFGEQAQTEWATTVLTAVATEDLSRVTDCHLIDLTGGDLVSILHQALPKAAITA